MQYDWQAGTRAPATAFYDSAICIYMYEESTAKVQEVFVKTRGGASLQPSDVHYYKHCLYLPKRFVYQHDLAEGGEAFLSISGTDTCVIRKGRVRDSDHLITIGEYCTRVYKGKRYTSFLFTFPSVISKAMDLRKRKQAVIRSYHDKIEVRF